jgi:4-hydroxy-tetrahydrodipicolinate synthase
VNAPAAGLPDFFGAVADATNLPVIVQDAPALTGVRITPRSLDAIAEHPLVRHVKVEAQPTAQKISELIDEVRADVTVLGGQNGLFAWEELDRGAAGTMPACEFTDELRRVLDDRQAGRREDGRARFVRLLPLLRYGLQSGVAWAVHKHVLVRRGIIATPTVRWPAVPLDARTAKELETLLDGFDAQRSRSAE